MNQLSRMEDSYCDSTNIGTDMAVAAHDADASLATDPRGDEEDDHEGGREDEKDGDLLAEDDAENQRFAMLEDSLVGRIVSQVSQRTYSLILTASGDAFLKCFTRCMMYRASSWTTSREQSF